MIAEQKARQMYGAFFSVQSVNDDSQDAEDDEVCAPVLEYKPKNERFSGYSRYRNDCRQNKRGGHPRGLFWNGSKCLIFNKLGHFRAEWVMLKEAVELNAKENGNNSSLS